MSEEYNLLEINYSFSNIKSKYILKLIFGKLQKNKLLGIIRYNKKLQKLLCIDINNYKIEYCKIEIEIIPFENTYGKFINMNNKDESYYHIYFNDNKEEIKRNSKKNFITKDDKVNKIKIILDYEIKKINNLFHCCKIIHKINFIKFNRKDFKKMNFMFYKCSSLKELNLSKFITDNVTDMSYMFYGCSSIEELNLSNFKTDKVTDMSYMFSGCTSLIKLNLSNFNTDNIKDMENMLQGCSKIKSLNCSDTYIIAQYYIKCSFNI